MSNKIKLVRIHCTSADSYVFLSSVSNHREYVVKLKQAVVVEVTNYIAIRFAPLANSILSYVVEKFRKI